MRLYWWSLTSEPPARGELAFTSEQFRPPPVGSELLLLDERGRSLRGKVARILPAEPDRRLCGAAVSLFIVTVDPSVSVGDVQVALGPVDAGQALPSVRLSMETLSSPPSELGGMVTTLSVDLDGDGQIDLVRAEEPMPSQSCAVSKSERRAIASQGGWFQTPWIVCSQVWARSPGGKLRVVESVIFGRCHELPPDIIE